MTVVFNKLNIKDKKEILVLNALESFEAKLAALTGVTILRHAIKVEKFTFTLAFVTTQKEVDAISKTIAKKAEGDPIIWFAYPKGTSKRYKCDFNRDSGWNILGNAGYERVRQVTIDEDWSALRFRRIDYTKTRASKNKVAVGSVH